GRLLGVGLQVIDAADAVEHLELQPAVVAQEAADLDQIARLHGDPRVDGVELLFLDLAAELLFQGLYDVGGGERGRHGRQALVGAASSLFFLAKAFAFSMSLNSSGNST